MAETNPEAGGFDPGTWGGIAPTPDPVVLGGAVVVPSPTEADPTTPSAVAPTWDEMTWWQKAGAYIGDIVPKAAAETVGLGSREGAKTVGGTISGAVNAVTGGWSLGTLVVVVAAGVGLYAAARLVRG